MQINHTIVCCSDQSQSSSDSWSASSDALQALPCGASRPQAVIQNHIFECYPR